jgi:hypothetical protein
VLGAYLKVLFKRVAICRIVFVLRDLVFKLIGLPTASR